MNNHISQGNSQQHWQCLSLSETLDRFRRMADSLKLRASAPAAAILSQAASYDARAAAILSQAASWLDASVWEGAFDVLCALPHWVGIVGIMRMRARAAYSWDGSLDQAPEYCLWLEAAPGLLSPRFPPGELVLSLGKGTRSVLALDTEKGTIVSRETCIGSPLVSCPSFDGAPLAILLRRVLTAQQQ